MRRGIFKKNMIACYFALLYHIFATPLSFSYGAISQPLFLFQIFGGFVPFCIVVCGRGCGHFATSKGNQAFRKLVEKSLDRYEDAPKTNKMDISQKIVAIVRKRGGKFLHYDPDSSKWTDMGDRRAIEKTSQTFRDLRMKPGYTPKPPPKPTLALSSKSKSSASSRSKPGPTTKKSSSKPKLLSKTTKAKKVPSSKSAKAAAKKKPSINNTGTKKVVAKPKPKKSKKDFLSPGSGWLSDFRLRLFISQQQECLKCTPIRFVNWLESEDIYTLEQFVDIFNKDPEFAVIQVKVNGVKWFKWNSFANAVNSSMGGGGSSSSSSSFSPESSSLSTSHFGGWSHSSNNWFGRY